MATKIFVNLPVEDLGKSIDFFKKLDFSFNAEFTDETAACMVVAEDINVMLLTHEKFKVFTPKEICDATKSTEVLVSLSCEAGRTSMNWFGKPSTPVEVPITTRRTMDSCMGTAFRTRTVTSGSYFTWNHSPQVRGDLRSRGSSLTGHSKLHFA